MKSPALTPALRDLIERDVRAALAKLAAGRAIDVHAVRKYLKHARAIVRLLQDDLSDATYRRINLTLRDAARRLSPTRDTEVLIATIARLERKQGIHALRPLQEALTNEQRKSRRASAAPRPITLAKQRLAALEQTVAKIDAVTTDWKSVIRAVGHTYRRARKAARRARSDRSIAGLHEWRKQVKYLWQQVQVVTPIAPRPLERLARDLHRLADQLGRHHDLALLEARITQGKEIDDAHRQELQIAIGRLRVRLERKACDSGKRLFALKPKPFERKLRRTSLST